MVQERNIFGNVSLKWLATVKCTLPLACNTQAWVHQRITRRWRTVSEFSRKNNRLFDNGKSGKSYTDLYTLSRPIVISRNEFHRNICKQHFLQVICKKCISVSSRADAYIMCSWKSQINICKHSAVRYI